MANNIRFGFDVDDGGAVRKLKGVSDQFDRIGGPGSSASLFGNVGAKAVAVGFNLIADAASGAIGFLQDSVQAFIEDQASVAELNQALKANIAGWNGNTAAIEANIAAKMDLGFTDEEQRHAMSLAVVATNDVTKAEGLLTAAMDLARLKHISLEEATTALIKVDDGHYRALIALGIVLPKNATAEDALTAVRKAAEGQAATYASTVQGKLTVAQIKFGEASEKVGAVIMPVLANVMTAAADEWLPAFGRGLDKVTGFLRGMDVWLDRATDRVRLMIKETLKLVGIQVNNPGASGGGFAAGGWVGLNGPERVLVGEKGPEYVVPNHKLDSMGGSGSGVTIVGVSAREIADIVDRELYVRIQRAAPTALRT